MMDKTLPDKKSPPLSLPPESKSNHTGPSSLPRPLKDKTSLHSSTSEVKLLHHQLLQAQLQLSLRLQRNNQRRRTRRQRKKFRHHQRKKKKTEEWVDCSIDLCTSFKHINFLFDLNE
jgi:hypothetical protein